MGHAIRTFVLGLAFVTIAVASGCGEHAADEEHAGGPTGAVCPPESMLTYDTFGQDFMTRYCVRCHSSALSGSARNGAPNDHDFDTLGGLRATHLDHIDEGAAAGPDAVNTKMPPSEPRPSELERRKLGEWLACGLP